MTAYIIIVEFTIDAADMATFLAHMLANARTTLQREAGCERFDVLRPTGSSDRILLYEVYRDRAAFDLHGTTPHYLAFAAVTAALIRNKSVTVYGLVTDPPSAAAA